MRYPPRLRHLGVFAPFWVARLGDRAGPAPAARQRHHEECRLGMGRRPGDGPPGAGAGGPGAGAGPRELAITVNRITPPVASPATHRPGTGCGCRSPCRSAATRSRASMTLTRTDRGATIGASTMNATASASYGSFITASSSDGAASPSAAMPSRCSVPAAARRASSRMRHCDPAGAGVHVSLAHVVCAADSSRRLRRRRSRPATPSAPAPRTGGPPRSCARSPGRRRSPCRSAPARRRRRAGASPRSS